MRAIIKKIGCKQMEDSTMGHIIKDLVTICQENKMTEKILIMESLSAGNQLIENSTKSGNHNINLKTKTLLDIAIENTRNLLISQDLELIGDDFMSIYIDMIVRDLLENGGLKYFYKLKAKPGFLKSIKNSILELRMAGFNSSNIRNEQFIDTKKAEDIRLVMKSYEKILELNNQIDTAALYNLGMKDDVNKVMVAGAMDLIYILPANTKHKKLEKEYLQYISGGNYRVIGKVNIENVQKPAIFNISGNDFGENEVGGVGISSYLYDIDKLKDYELDEILGETKIELINAYGIINETKAVIRNIKKTGTSFDQNLVLLTVQEPYTQLIYLLCEKHKIPVTFSEGINIRNTKSGKFLFGLVDWVSNNFMEKTFTSIIRNGYLTTIEEKPSFLKIQNMMNKALIGWGRDRYITCLDNLKNVAQDPKKQLKEEELKSLTWIRMVVEAVLAKIPTGDREGKCELSVLARGLGEIIREYSKTNSELEAAGKEAILEKLGVLEKYQGSSMLLGEALHIINDAIENICIGASNPKPGKLHVASYRRGLWIARENTYIIGLDSSRFPGQVIEDPILLDIERLNLGNGLPLLKEKAKVNEYELLLLFEELTGNLRLSYSSYNTIEHKEQNPASILLQFYRLLEQDGSLDYKDLKGYFGNIEGYIGLDEAAVLSEKEWWLKKTIYDGAKIPSNLFDEVYSGIARGVQAREKQTSIDFTEYDGKVNFDIGKYKRQINGIPKFSASQLEKLAKCPYSYFLSYILGFKKIDELEFNMEVWLDPLSKGSLLHSIYERFLITLKEMGEVPNSQKHNDLILSIGLEEIEKLKLLLPPPSERVYNYEKDLLLADCLYFIKVEEIGVGRLPGFRPEYFEMSFGNDKGKELSIDLKSGKSIYIGGYIDRVDKRGKEEYLIIDYKTGGTYGFGHKDYFNQGRHVQHALYAIALEKTLKEAGVSANPKVIESGYLFPTSKGQGQWIGRDVTRRDEIYGLLDDLLEIFEEGSFIRTEDMGKPGADPCTYCDYRVICQNYSNGMVVIKSADNDDKGLAAKRRLKYYE